VAAVVAKQVEAGIDVVNDGEMSKPSYATYIKDRLDGFGGESHPLVYQDLVDFPEFARRVFGDPGRSRRKTPGCNGPIKVRDPAAAETDVDNLKAALSGVSREAFLSAASPGVISLFFHNGHYPTEEAYLYAIAEAMRPEYETVAKAGFILQIDCPDLAMGRHIQYAALSIAEFARRRSCTSRRSITHWRISRRTSCAYTCAGVTTKARITATSHCATSFRPCFWQSQAAFPLRRPTRAMRMSGRCLRTSNCPMAKC
jgi:methionine synthase II (cobalamin-independent)